jgi:general secretion pathway protein K
LWLSLAIVTVVLAFSLEARRDRLSVANAAEYSQALAAARAGIATTLSRLDRLSTGTAPMGSMPYDQSDAWQWADTLLSGRVDLGGVGYDVRVRDEGAQLDVNRATQQQWLAFFTALNLDYDTGDRLAQAITDWRDLDDDPQARGAERAEYIRAGRLVLPTNRNFESVDELHDVLGMTPELFDRIEPYLSTNSPDGRINVNTAPIPVLRTITGLSDNAVAIILARRSTATRIRSLQELGQGVSPQMQNQVTFTTQTMEIRSVGWSPGGQTRATAMAIVYRSSPNAAIQQLRQLQ